MRCSQIEIGSLIGCDIGLRMHRPNADFGCIGRMLRPDAEMEDQTVQLMVSNKTVKRSHGVKSLNQ